MQKYIKGMTLAILMTFLATMIPSYNVVAKEKNTDSSVKVQQGTESDGLIVGEVTEKREENVKHFMKDDGTFVAMMYNNPVHYKEGSEWKDIDNTLVEKDDTKGIVESKEDILKEATIFSDVSTSEATGKTIEGSDGKNSIETVEEAKESAEEQVKSDESVSKEKEISAQNKEVKVDSKSTEKAANDKEINKGKNNKVLENKSNDFKISIAQNINADKLVSINKDKYEVSWNIKSDKNVKVNKKETTDEDVNKLLGLTNEQEKKLSKKEKAELENSKKATLIKTTSSVVFEEVKPNINLEYKLISDSIKESIIINKPTDIKKFSFNFNMKNLKPELKDNQIILSDKDTGKEIMRMQAPFMVDAKGEQTDRVKLSFDKKGKGYILTLELDKEWINSKDRQYPVIVDPSFESSVRSSDIRDTFVAANDTEDKSTNMFLRVGNTPQIGATRTFIKFTNLPQLSMGDMIIDAKLYLLKIPSQSGTDGQIDVHKVTNDWNNVGLRWSNQPSIDWTIKDYQNYSSNNWQYWDITDIAKEWYTTGNNYGLCVKKNDERSGHSTYLSSDTSDSNGYPSVYFSYVNNSGLQSYWTYHSQSVGRAGTTNINDYNGNVIHVHDDVAMSGNRLPTVIKHVYNSNDRGVDIGFGPGWRLNLSQKVIYKQIGSKKYYQYTDEDGTRRYFEDTGTEMKEEYSGELTLVKNANGSFTIKDKDNNALLFNNIGDLEEITDSNANKLDLQYYDGKLKYVVDGAGRVTKLEYSIYGKLQEIYYPDNTKVRFDYSGDIMKWITYADGKQSVYDYNGQNNLTSVTNIDGYKMSYEYYSQSPNRIKKVTEGNTDGTVGSSMSYEYSYNSTKFTDNKNRVNYYQFDNSGKTISIRDAAGYAQAYEYGDGTNINKMTLESKLQKSVSNLIMNGSAEEDRNFNFGAGGGGTGSAEITSEQKYIGSRSLKLSKGDNTGSRYIDQVLSLQKGKTYTFSAYVKTSNISQLKSKGAGININYKDKNGVYNSVRSKFLTGTNDWTRLETTFTYPTDSVDSNVILRCELWEESGVAYYDALQLEDGTIANKYNLVENGDLSGGAKIPNYWSDEMYGGVVRTEASDTRLLNSDSDHPSYLDANVFKLTGRQGKDTRINQTIKVNGKAGDSFVVGGWAKGSAVSHGAFAIQAMLVTTSGEQWETFYFNRDSKNWQFINGVAKAKNDYSELHIYLVYSDNANEAQFDGIQVYKEEFGDTYQYDSKGNIISSVDLSKQQTKFEYNGSNDLIKTTDPKGNQFKYEYDSKKNITKATTAENLIYNFEYDSYGNAIKSKIFGVSLFIESSAKYTSNGNYISSVTDSLGNTVGYNYEETKGTLTSTTDAKGNVTNYKYDINNALSSVTKKVDGVDISNSYTYKNDRIDTIGHNGFTYNFIYDTLGRTTGVNVGSQRLITNTYEANGGNLIESTYGNGAKVQTDYDNLDRVVAKRVNGSEIEHYSYDASGNLAILEDKVNNTTYKYNYDSADRLVNLTDSKGNSYKNEYDANNNVSKQMSSINGQKRETAFEFDKDNKITKFIFNNGNNFIQYTYDEIARNKEKTLNLGNNVTYKTTAQYLPGINNSTSSQVGTISNNGSEIKYTYDKNSNIETIVQGKNIEPLNPGKYEEDNPNIKFTGNWLKDSNSGYSGGTVLYSAGTIGDSVEFKFIGTGFNLVQPVNQYRGIAKLTIDGISQNIDTYSASEISQKTVFSKLDLPFGMHEVKIEVTVDRNPLAKWCNQAFDYVEVLDNNTRPLTKGKYEEDNPNIKFNGKWMKDLNSGYSGGTVLYSGTIGDSIDFSFIGTGFNWAQPVNSYRGISKITIDGVEQRLDTYSASEILNRVVFSKTDLSLDIHSVKIEITENKNQSSKGYNQSLDYIEILNGSQSSALTAGKYEENNPNIKFYGNWLKESTSLHSGGAIQYTETIGDHVDFSFTGTGFKWIQSVNSYRGISKITIDGIVYTVDTYSENEIAQKVVFSKTDLTYGTHYVRIEATSNKNPLSKWYNQAFDYIEIVNTKLDDSKTTKYYYNELNELIREDNQVLGKTILYNYDTGGNITSKREYDYTTGTPGTVTNNVAYGYGDTNWKDKLTSYNGKNITYDAIGNPLTYDGYTYTWERGRTLTKIAGNNKDISYKYDGSGIRTEKNANGVVSKYTLLGDKVVYEEVTNGSNVDKIYYTYDGSGILVSMNLNSVEYFYVRNLQGDIIALIDKTGAQVVTYNYDSWGKLISIEGTLKDSVGVKNPYRYRGYRYDNETGMYYLQSRYYNPEWGRFINADGLIGQTGDLLTHNMFAYCKNNPILLKDENGFRPMISTSWDNEVAIGRGSQEYDSYKGIWGSVTNIIKKQVIDIVYGSITYNKSVPIFSNGEVGISTPKIFKYQIKLGGSYTLGPYNKVDDSFYEFGVGAEVKPLEIAIREENNYGHLNINTEINPSVGLGGKASIGLARWDRGKYGVKFNLSGEKVVGGGATIEIYWDANNN
ncbi:DNRLRE domain-containing protein [Clostridium intestinale]|uniref:RHS repeat-associated core domain-containing protein n=1 Tax=Clostridium intestinale DSM 6191 TaxID=1121320 RepID=A0A1M5V169_9CLOT|nr:DNRLRE domain-containing protein [Clostridium intestinale]SHH68969.1 RHS repeat-associated core domain-containing protein [Clostridium intestinale DSM 6191]